VSLCACMVRALPARMRCSAESSCAIRAALFPIFLAVKTFIGAR